MPPSGCSVGMSKWEKSQTQSLLKELHIPPGLGKPSDSLGTAGNLTGERDVGTVLLTLRQQHLTIF